MSAFSEFKGITIPFSIAICMLIFYPSTFLSIYTMCVYINFIINSIIIDIVAI